MSFIKYIKIAFILSILSFSKLALSIEIQVNYNEHANILHYLDNLSLFPAEHVNNNYRDFWEIKNFIQDEDNYYLKMYAKVRKKYYKNLNLLLSRPENIRDPIAEAFYKANSLINALDAVKKIVSLDDYIIIENSINHFFKRIEKLILNKNHMIEEAEYIKHYYESDEGLGYIKKMCNFYNVSPEKIKIYIVYEHQSNMSSAYQFSDMIILRRSEKNGSITTYDTKNLKEFFSIIMHEIAHYLSSQINNELANNYKLKFKASLKKGVIENWQKSSTLFIEEPLAVMVGQMYYLHMTDPDHFEYFSEFYNQPLVNIISKLCYPLIWHYLSNNKPIDDIIFVNLAKSLNQVSNLLEN